VKKFADVIASFIEVSKDCLFFSSRSKLSFCSF
jgi:hypothetical protein